MARTIGDIEAKLEKYGGNPKVVVATPDIYQFKLKDHHDFIVLGTDGIFDKMSSEDVGNAVWATRHLKNEDVHQYCGKSVESIIKVSMAN